tara:strand:- start:1610 stop:1822 length:213 start_codon:yes stop_codon:yes gene_type:complete
MNWKDIIKGHMSNNTEWWTQPGSDKVHHFSTEREAEDKATELNHAILGSEPKWEVYATFGKPMLKRVWPE